MAIKRDKIDILFSRYVKLLADGYCQRCHKHLGIKSRGLHAAHCFSRGKKTVRFDRNNACALCYGCHRFLDGHPLEKTEFFINLLGLKGFQELDYRAHQPKKIDIEVIEADLKKKIQLLEGK